MALRLEGVAVDRVGQLLRCVSAEMHELASIGTHAGGDEHQPREQFATRLGRVVGQELAGFLGEVEQDRVAVEHDRVTVDDCGHLGVRIDRQILRLMLLTFTRVDRDRVVRKSDSSRKSATFVGLGAPL